MPRLPEHTRYSPRPTARTNRGAYSLLPLLVLGFGIHLLAAVANEGIYPGEEHYRYLGLAQEASVLGHKQEMPSELRQRRAPGLLPVIGHFFILGATSVNIGSPFLQATVLRVLSSLLGILAALYMFGSFRGDCTSQAARRWLFLLLLLLWFLPSLQARFSPENWSGILFFLGIAWYYQKGEQGEASMIIAGFLIGLSFFVRFQTAAMILGFVAWLLVIERADRRVMVSLAGGAVIAAILGTLADKILYGTWTLTPWNAFLGMFADAEISQAGHPWWNSVVEVLWGAFLPIGILLVVSTFVFLAFARRHILTWVLVPYLLLHVLTPPSELRELFPLTLAIPVIMVLAIQRVLESIPRGVWQTRATTSLSWMAYLLLGLNLVLALGASLMPADPRVPMYRFVYDRYGGAKTILVHMGKDPYDRADISLGFYTPSQLTRVPLNDGELLRSVVAKFPGSRIILASDRERLPERIRTEGMRLRHIYGSVPEWTVLVSNPQWFRSPDTLVLYEVENNGKPPIAAIHQTAPTVPDSPESTQSTGDGPPSSPPTSLRSLSTRGRPVSD